MPGLRRLGATLLASAVYTTTALAQTPTPPAPVVRLEDILTRAIDQNPLVDAARQRVRAAQGLRLTARSFTNPIFTYQLENTAFSGGASGANIDRETSIYATVPLEPLFQRAPRVRAADAEIGAARAEVDLARRSVALDASRAFFAVALAQTTVAGAVDVRDRLQELAAYTRPRVAEGVSSEGDLIRVEVEVDRAESALALAQADLARARGSLAPYLGTTAPATASVRVEIDTSGAAASSGVTGAAGGLAPVDSYLTRARSVRPDLTAARRRVDAARAQATYQRTLTVRQLGATFGTKRIGDMNTLIAGFSLPVPVFDQNRGGTQRASAELAAAELELGWRERQVAAEVAAAHEAARLLGVQRERLARGSIARAEEARRIALAAYLEGAASLLQVIDASRTLADLRNAYYRTLVAERESLLELQLLSGTELSSAAGSAAPPSTSPPPSPEQSAQRDGATP